MTTWQPTADLATLCQRAKLIQLIRNFFSERDVLEVETPILGNATTTDVHIASLATYCLVPGYPDLQKRFLQTSPEFAMKRLLAAGSGPIFQISKAFRQDPSGKLHNPEFTLLEWYRPGLDHHQLIDEVDALLQSILHTSPSTKITYQQLFSDTLGVCPFTASVAELQQIAIARGLDADLAITAAARDQWLHLLMSHLIEPDLGRQQPLCIYDYPLSQGGFARQNGDYTTARFEFYVSGIELANGYHEITDSKQQRQRFAQDNQQRQQLGLGSVPIDNALLAALEHGMPDCAGVALGVDRLLMLALHKQTLQEVMSFTN